MTYSQVLEAAFKNGDNLADIALGRMMDTVEAETGKWPEWNDQAPEWIIKNMIGVCKK